MAQNFGENCTVKILPNQKSTQTLIIESEETEDAFCLCDLGDVITKYDAWMKNLPSVKPFYAVKCNGDPAVLKVLATLGASFDCASKVEIDTVLKLGVSPSRIIFANPCKQASFIRFAKNHNVSMMTFDNGPELHKIKDIYPDAELVLRILPTTGFKVLTDLGMKFGCHPKRALCLLQLAKRLNLNVMGISFHVGSGCQDFRAFEAAISAARGVCDEAIQTGFNITLLDIGGGFPGRKSFPYPFKQIAELINGALDKYFPTITGIKVVAEPGTYFVASALTLVVNIIAKNLVKRDDYITDVDTTAMHSLTLPDAPNDFPQKDVAGFMYYVNDGVYGCFNCVLNNPDQKLSVTSLRGNSTTTTTKMDCQYITAGILFNHGKEV